MNSTILVAVEHFKSGEIMEARNVLEIPESKLDNNAFFQEINSYILALTRIESGNILDAEQHLLACQNLIELSNDQEIKLVIPALIEFINGLRKLYSGDSFGAAKTFDSISNVLEKFVIIEDGLKKFMLASKVAAYIAMSRTCIAASDIIGCERYYGECERTLIELEKECDIDDEDDIDIFVLIYGTPIEISSALSLLHLQTLDTTTAKERISQINEKLDLLKSIIPRMQPTSTKDMAESIVLIGQSLKIVIEKSEKIFYQNTKNINQDDITDLASQIPVFSRVEYLSKRAGERGSGYLFIAEQTKAFCKNLLNFHKINREYISQYSGIISFLSFITLMLIVEIFINPSESYGLLYFFGALILALIVGFGFAAVKFIPLLRLYKELLSKN